MERLREELDNAQTWEEYEDIAYRLDAYVMLLSPIEVVNMETIYGDRIRSISIMTTN